MKRGYNKQTTRFNTMIESLIVMLLLCLIFFGLLQAVHIAVTQMVTDYSAACTVRSSVVGFTDRLLVRSARIASIASSGKLIYPDHADPSPMIQFEYERDLIPRYLSGEVWYLTYEHMPLMHADVRSSGSNMRRAEVEFSKYPINFPFWETVSGEKTMNIKAEAKAFDHASYFLEN